jgi:hypothetical protein
MNRIKPLYACLTWFIAIVWIINGLYCKVLNLVPRHRLIVARMLGTTYAGQLTMAIGSAEILMAIWILIRVWPRFSAITQIIVIGVMNALELFIAPDLLLFGRLNAVLALLFMGVIYYQAFILHPKIARS